MRSTTLIAVLIQLCFLNFCYSQVEIRQEIEFGNNPGDLKAFVYSSSEKKRAETKRPLLVALHGCSQTGNNLSSISGWSQMAKENNFVVLYPEQRRINNPSKCFNWFNLKDITRNSGELESIINMIDHSIETYNIDPSQIYIYGVSAGAAMGVCLLATYPEYFKSGAIFAGAPYKVAVTNWQATKAMLKTVDRSPEEWGDLVTQDSIKRAYPKLIVCHGTDDNVVDIRNSYELIEQWTDLHQIDTIPDEITPNYMSADLTKMVYKDSSGAEKIIFYEFSNLGHRIPIDPGKSKTQGGRIGMYSKDVGYFSTYYVAKEFNLLKD